MGVSVRHVVRWLQTDEGIPMTTPNLDIDALERRARAATPGPWYQAGQPWFRTGSGVLAGSPDPHAGFMIVDTETWDGEREEYLDNDGAVPLASPDDDAAYIAATNPQTMLALCAALRAEREKVAEARKIITRMVEETRGQEQPCSYAAWSAGAAFIGKKVGDA